MKIAIVALNGSPLIDPSESPKIGGLETFAWGLARSLALDPADDVLFLVRSRRKLPALVDGVHVASFQEPCRNIRQSVSDSLHIEPATRTFRIKRWNNQLLWQVPLLAFRKLFLRSFSQVAAMEHAIGSFQPDLILTLGVNETSSQLGGIARDRKIPIVLWLQSNADLEPKLYETDSFVDRYGVQSSHAQASLQLCRTIICQSQSQLAMFKALAQKLSGVTFPAFHVSLIRNPIDTNRFHGGQEGREGRSGVLWIGRADRFHKRPLLALEVARLCPKLPFRFILNSGEPEIRQQVENKRPPNVEIVDFVPTQEMPRIMRESRLFLSTGSQEYEGFPNVLLEAAASGTPIVTLEDFDNFLKQSHAGLALGGSVESAAQALNRLYEAETVWTEHSSAGKEYVQQMHLMDKIVLEFKKLAKTVVSAND